MVHSSYKDDDFKSILSPYILRFLKQRKRQVQMQNATCRLCVILTDFSHGKNYHLFVLSNQTLRYGGED